MWILDVNIYILNVYILKDNYIYETMDYSALTKQDKKDIFEVVNSTHLYLKGPEKTALKRDFVDGWKLNKKIGAFQLMLKLYESDAVYDKMNESFLEYVKDGYDNEYYRNHKNIPYAKHIQRMQWRSEEVDKAEQDLEDIKHGKGYISQEEHEYELNKVKEEQLQIIRERGDTIIKLRNLETGLRAKLTSSNDTFEAMKLYYEDIIKQLTNTES